MALAGNDVHRASTVSSRSKPLKSSPLAGPAVVGAVSLNDNDNDINNTTFLSPSSLPPSPSVLPTRPKSVHHPLSTLRSRPRSAQSFSRPVSWYAYPAGEGGVGVGGTGVGGNDNGEGSLHGNEDIHLNTRPKSNTKPKTQINPYRKRPSTAPGPSTISSKDNDKFSLSIRGRLAVVSTSSRQVQAQPSLGAQPTPLPNSSHVRYSNSPSVATSAAGSAGGSGIRPTSILVDPDVPQPRPILKHRTSFVVPPQLSSTTASSSRSSVLSSNSDEFGSISRSRSRLSVVSNASAGSSAYQSHHSTYIKNIDTSETNKESWYTFSPYANTPKFSRLGLASAGVVMPVSKKEAVKERERRSSAVSSTSSKGKGEVTTNVGNRKSADLSGARVSISSTREEERGTQQERRPPPLPLSSSTITAAAPWLNVPSATSHGSPAHSSSSSSAQTDTSTSPSGSSRSSPASSVASLEVDADVTCGATLRRKEGRRGQEQAVDPEDQEGKEKEREEEKVDDECVVEVIPTLRQKPKEKRKTLSLSSSLKSWRSLRSSHGSALRHDVPDVPPPPSNNVISTSSLVNEQSKEDLDEEGCVGIPVTFDNGSGPLVLQPVVPTPTDFLQLPKSDSIRPTTQPTLKKRKSASALLARVKNWRWKKEEPSCSTEDAERERDGNEGAGFVNMANDESVCAVEGDQQDAGGAESNFAEFSNEDTAAVEVLDSDHAAEVENGGVEVVAVDLIVDVEGPKDNYGGEEDEEEKDEEGSADSPYPGSTPSSTHSVPSFVPMSMMIPSPNLHVEDGRVPEFIEGQLSEGVDGQAVQKSVLIEVDESSRLIEVMPIKQKPIPTAVPVFKVMNDDEELPYAEATINDESNGAATKDSSNTVASISEDKSNPVAAIDEGSGPVAAIDDESKPVQVAAIDDADVVSQIVTVTVTRPVSPSPSQQAPEALHIDVHDTSHTSTTDKLSCGPIPDQSSTPIPILDQAPSQAPGHPSMPLDHSESFHPGRSSTRSNRSKSRGRSSSVRRMWNAFVCGGAEAEQMAVADAWAEIQADRGRVMQQGKTEEEKTAAVQIVIVGVDPAVDSKVPQSRHSFSNIGTAL